MTGRPLGQHAEEYLLVTKTQAVAFGSGLEKIDWAGHADQLRNIGKYLKRGSRLDIEYRFTYGEGEYLKRKLPGVKITPGRSPADELRQVKDAQELARIRKSMQIVEKVFTQVRAQLKKKVWTEVGLAKFIQTAGLKLGAEDVSFPAIVASGANAAVPHHLPGSKKLKAGESIILDFGFKYQNYCSDFTRTVFLKTVPNRLAEAYKQVEKAYTESILILSLRGVRPLARNDKSITGDQVYQKSVNVLAEKHLEKYFIHSLGHGTGLEIHELPNLSPKSKDILTNGMVFSIEPGVYLPRSGGIRIEDLVYLKDGRCNKFIQAPTTLKDIIIK